MKVLKFSLIHVFPKVESGEFGHESIAPLFIKGFKPPIHQYQLLISVNVSSW